jgi:hypothetical protein
VREFEGSSEFFLHELPSEFSPSILGEIICPDNRSRGASLFFSDFLDLVLY